MEEANHLRDGTLEIAAHFHLTLPLAARLFISLGSSKLGHHIGKLWDEAPPAAGIAKELEKIEKSLERVARFAMCQDRKHDAAVRSLLRAADRWAVTRERDEIEQYGFRYNVLKDPEYEWVDYSSQTVVEGWFALAPLMAELAKAARQALTNGAEELLDREKVPSATILLVGGRLPRLYERITGERFGRSRGLSDDDSINEKVRDVRGVKFVGMALVAMGLSPLTPETISRYRSAYSSTAEVGDG